MNNNSTGITFGSLLFVVFLILKLTHVIDWSWYWVAAPLWIPLAIVAVIMVVAFCAMVLKEARR